jgi:hypothetical protein
MAKQRVSRNSWHAGGEKVWSTCGKPEGNAEWVLKGRKEREWKAVVERIVEYVPSHHG